ncbi:hypothetical protein FNO01nite_17140 [Flavobacterium noncentrifugens]|uniref:DUF5777 domain-containing protein n=1 Tax=Flavobacterium noncentrifugens TaxID=1128970 RepID=A0A1G8WUN2_9FLAO|nr:DUF5777 family beta-barrel protein [Flavobacterium noncentrifugens]GEP51042.1 hypothetical protein FNO01nite_17140 [Flavobacterium noncentrifugens]SDJ81335.1 hypothetical protein SAMN04487935_1940 [Flavobacterium noncentrifugens]
MKIKKIATFTFALLTFGYVQAQEDLLGQLDQKPDKKEIETTAFKGLQVVSMQSTKMAAKGEFYFVISHRFGDLTNGLDNFFGLDNAYTKLGGIYGVTNWFSVGLSRQTYNKVYELTGKYKLADQQIDGFPVTIVGYNTMDVNTKLSTDEYPNLKGNNRLAYTTQLPISHKFSNSFSLEVNPVFVHKNLYDPLTENKDQFLIASGGRYKLSKRLSLNLEYAARINAPEHDVYHNPLSVGLDIETGGHVFQLLFSNSQAINDVAFFTNATGKWNGGGIYFGFNMYRVF